MINLAGEPGVLYSRKSRKDIEAEREAAERGKPYDTLEKHRIALLELAKKNEVVVIDILEEIVSGEFISERPKMQKVMDMLQNGEIRWVGVMDEDRLGRGDKIDQGRIERAFKESGAYILTPNKIVDMQDEADELYMDYKGMGARYEYKQTKKRLQGGRVRSAGRGNYIGANPPFGYLKGIDYKTEYPHLLNKYVEKAADMENLKLYPHPVEAQIIVNIFKMFIAGERMTDIIEMLSGEVHIPRKSKGFNYKNIHRMLINPVYRGAIRLGKRKYTKTETGKYRYKVIPDDQLQITENAHIPLISKEDFEAAQKRISENKSPKVNKKKTLVNPMATILKCHYCGSPMSYRIYYSNPQSRNPSIICQNFSCKKNHSVGYHHVEKRLLEMIELFLSEKLADPQYHNPVKEVDQLSIFESKKNTINKKIADAKNQLASAHEYLELKVYSIDVFLERQKTLLEKIEIATKELKEIELSISEELLKKKNSELVIPKLRNVLETYSDAKTVREKNNLLKDIVQAVYYSKPEKGHISKTDFYLDIVWKPI